MRSTPPPTDHRSEPKTKPDPVQSAIASGDSAALSRLLTESEDWQEVERIARALARAAGALMMAEPSVVRALADRLPEAPRGSRGAILDALARTSDRKAVSAVMDALGRTDDPNARAEIIHTLIAQTGKTDLGGDPAAWASWWSQTEWIPEAEWLQRIARWQADRASHAEAEAERLEKRVVETHRALYAATPENARPALIAQILRDPAPGLRRLGLELASRAVLDATPMPDDVFDAVATLLTDPSADIRASSARLLASAGLDRFGAELSAATRVEKSPEAAAAMFDALAFARPGPEEAAIAARWITDDVAGPAGAKALVRAIDLAVSMDPDSRAAAWSAVREDAGVGLGPAGVALFGRLAPDDRSFLQIGRLLSSEDEAIKAAAADALARRAVGLDPLMNAGDHDPGLVRAAADAIRRFMPTAAGWSRLCTLPDLSDELRIAVATALPADEAIKAATQEPSAELRLVLLDRFAQAQQAADHTLDNDLARRARAIRREALFELGRFDEVLAEDDPEGDDASTRAAFSPVIASLLCLDRTEDAAGKGASAQDWLAAIRRLEASNPPLCLKLIRELGERADISVDGDLQQELNTIERRVQKKAAPEAESSQTEPNTPKSMLQ